MRAWYFSICGAQVWKRGWMGGPRSAMVSACDAHRELKREGANNEKLAIIYLRARRYDGSHPASRLQRRIGLGSRDDVLHLARRERFACPEWCKTPRKAMRTRRVQGRRLAVRALLQP